MDISTFHHLTLSSSYDASPFINQTCRCLPFQHLSSSFFHHLLISLLYILQRPLLRRVSCCGARGRLPPTGMSMCRTSTSGRSTTPKCGIKSKLQPCSFFLIYCFTVFLSLVQIPWCPHVPTSNLPLYHHTLFALPHRLFSLCHLSHPVFFSQTPIWCFFSPFPCGSVGRTAWLCVPSSTDTDLTSLTTPNWERCTILPLFFSCSDCRHSLRLIVLTVHYSFVFNFSTVSLHVGEIICCNCKCL